MFREPMKLVQDDTKYVRLADFSGGRNTTISPALLNVNESPTAECVSFDQKGTIYPSWGRIKRYEKPFTDRPITGLGEFRKTDGTTRLMIGAGDAVYYDSPNLPWTWEGDKFDNGTLYEMEKYGNKLKSIKRELTFLGPEEVAGQLGDDPSFYVYVREAAIPVVLEAGAIVRKIGIPVSEPSSSPSYTVSVALSLTYDGDALVQVDNVILPTSRDDVAEVELYYKVPSSGTYWIRVSGKEDMILYWKQSIRELPEPCRSRRGSDPWETTSHNYGVFVTVNEAFFEDGKLEVGIHNELAISPGIAFGDQDAVLGRTPGSPQTFNLGPLVVEYDVSLEEVSLPLLPSGTARGCAFDPTGTYLAVAHDGSPYITIYKRSGDTFTKLDNPDTLPAGNGRDCTFDPTGTYLAVAHDGSPYITIYKRDGDTFTKIANPDTLPTDTGQDCAFDPTGTYLAVAHNSTPRITIYKRSGDTFTKLANPSSLPANDGRGCAFDPTGTYLAVAHRFSPRITIYKRSGDTFTKLDNPDTLPAGNGRDCTFDPTGTYLAVAHDGSPYITIYKRDGDTFTKIANPDTLPTDTAWGCTFDPTGTYLAVVHSYSPYITIYKRDGDTFTKVANPSTLPTNTGQDCAFDPTGTYLAVAHSSSPYITIHKRDGDTFTKLADPSTLPTSSAWGPTGTYLAVCGSSFLYVYKRNDDGTFVNLPSVPSFSGTTLYNVVFHPTGEVLFAGSRSTIYILSRTGDTFTTAGSVSLSDMESMVFDPTGTYLAIGRSSSSQQVHIYKFNRDNLTLSTVTSMSYSARVVTSIAFDPTGTYLAVGCRTSTDTHVCLFLYRREGDTFTRITLPQELEFGGGEGVNNVCFNSTGEYLFVTATVAPYVHIYKIDDGSVTTVSPEFFGMDPNDKVTGIVFDPTGTYMATRDPFTLFRIDDNTFVPIEVHMSVTNLQSLAFDPFGRYLALVSLFSPQLVVLKLTVSLDSSVVGDLYPNGRLVISGEGAIYDFSSPEESPFHNNTLVESLVIHDGITHLGSYAFCECPNLKEIRNYCGEGQTLGTDVFLNSGANISDKKAYGIGTNTEFMVAMEDSGYKWNDLYSNQTHFELGFKITSLGSLQTLLDLNGVEEYTLVVNITPEGKIEVISPYEEVISDLEITTDTDYLLRVIHTSSVIQVFLNDELYVEIHDVNYVVTNDNPMYFARGVTGYIWGFRVIRNGFEFIRADLAHNLNIICSGAWVSPVVDVSNAKDLSTGYASVLTESGSYLVQSRSADNENGPWSDWVPASDAGKLLHELKPYVQLRIVGINEALITSVTMYFDGMPTATLLKDGLTPNAMYCFRTFGDRIIIANGYDPLMAWDGESEAPVLVGGDPPPFQFIEVHQNRLWGWGGLMPSRLRYSDILNADSWPALNFIDVNPDDGDHPTGLKTYGAYLLLPKSKRIAVLIGDQASNYSVTWLESSFGIQGMNAISSTDKYLSYVAQDGIRFTDMTSSVTAVERLLPDWEKINKRLLYKAAQIYWGHTLLTALPGPDAVSGNTEVWMYDALRNAWTIRYDWKLSCFLRFIEYGEEVLLAGDSTTGQIYKIVPDPYNDGIPVQYKWKSKDLNFGEPERYKVWPVVFLQVEGEYEQRTLKVRFFVDGRETGGPDLAVPAGKGMIFTFRLVPPQYGAVYGQRLAISLEGSNGVHLITIGYTLRTFSVGV